MTKQINHSTINKRKYSDLETSYDYEYILKLTADYEKYARINNKKYNTKTTFRIKSLIFLGRFDEALKLCYEALDTNLLKPENVELVNYYIFMIFFYKKEFIKCFALINNLYDFDEKKTIKEKYFRIIEDMIHSDSPETYEKLFELKKEHFVTHVIKRRGEDFNIDFNIITDVIIKNFAYAKVYYQNMTEVRIFRCFNAGKSNYYGKTETCAYIIVHSQNSSPKSLITAYLSSSVDNLDFCDITNDVYTILENKNNPKVEIKSANLHKFRVRQAKKKN